MQRSREAVGDRWSDVGGLTSGRSTLNKTSRATTAGLHRREGRVGLQRAVPYGRGQAASPPEYQPFSSFSLCP